VSLSDLYSQFLSCESRLEGRNPSNKSNNSFGSDHSVNATARGGGNRGGFGYRGDRGGR
jgi:hypothetical protein